MRKMKPAAPPTATLARRHLNIRRASSGCGSDAAIIDAIAQIGLLSLMARSVCQMIAVPRATLTAKSHPCSRSYRRPNRIIGVSPPAALTAAPGLLMRRGGITLQPVHDAGLRRVEGYPVLGRVLKRDEERRRPCDRVLTQILAVLEADLKGELADERAVLAARPPERDVRLGLESLAEIDGPDVLKHFLDDGVVDER